jgi:hypothetical protein
MLLAKRREKPNPVDWIYKFWYVLLFNSHLQQNMILTFDAFWKLWRVSIILQLKPKLFRSSRYWHTSAVETEREQHIISTKSFVPCIEVTFWHRKSMSYMQKTIHICIGEGDKKFRLFWRLNREILISIPYISCSSLKTN